MEFFTVFILVSLSLVAHAQQDTLPAGVYALSKSPVNNHKKIIVKGRSAHLARLEIFTTSLAAGKSIATSILPDIEQLIIIKEGMLRLTVKDSSRLVGPGSISLVLPGDPYALSNASGAAATYFILQFTSRSPIDINRGVAGGGSLTRSWDELKKQHTPKGESRAIFDQPTAMFSKFDAHATSLDRGMVSHDPHTHPAEEIILVIKGHVEEQIGQTPYPATAGDVIYLASNVLHNVKNAGKEQCSYFAIQWRE